MKQFASLVHPHTTDSFICAHTQHSIYGNQVWHEGLVDPWPSKGYLRTVPGLQFHLVFTVMENGVLINSLSISITNWKYLLLV